MRTPTHWSWYTPAGLMALLVMLPLLVLALSWQQVQWEVWQHLAATGLGRLVSNTLVLMLGVGVLVTLLGVSLAWLTGVCEFPGRAWFDWALLLPLAMPTYVAAFVAMGLMSYSGPVLSLWRELFGPTAWYPDIRQAGGVVVVMSCVLYPYVYMLARAAFMQQGRSLIDVARTLGHSPWSAFWHLALPMAKPAIVAGVSLALMEALADFGAVSVFNFDTFTTAIYKSWFGFFNLQAAAQLASLLLLLVALALVAEQTLGAGQNPAQSSSKQPSRIPLTGARRWWASAYCFSVLAVCFLLPLGQLLVWVIKTGLEAWDLRFFQRVQHSFLLAALAALLVVAMAVLVSFAQRRIGRAPVLYLTRFTALGYALPGSVLAVAVMMAFTSLDAALLWPLFGTGQPSGQILVGSLFALLLAYLIRYFSVGLGPVQTGLGRIRPSYQEAAQSLGLQTPAVMRRIYWPLLRPSIFTALVLVLVDVMKEMPATLLLRPFGWDTLAVRVYEMTSEGEWQKAALPAICLVGVSMIPVIMLIRRSR